MNDDTCRMAFHRAVEHSSQSSRVILGSHEHDGPEMMLVAPRWKHPTFIVTSIDSGDFDHIGYAKQPQPANLPRPLILVRKPPANELLVCFRWNVSEDPNSLCNTAMHKVGRFERPLGTGSNR